MVGGLQRLTTFTTAAFNSEWSLRLPTTFYILLQEPPKSLEVMQGILVTMIKLSYINPRHRPKKASTATWRCIYIYIYAAHPLSSLSSIYQTCLIMFLFSFDEMKPLPWPFPTRNLSRRTHNSGSFFSSARRSSRKTKRITLGSMEVSVAGVW